jgi:Domain of unknown function (DUF4386)
MTATAVTSVDSSVRSRLSTTGAAVLLLAPLLALVARVLATPWYQDEADQPDTARYLDELAESATRNEIGSGLAFVGAIAFVGVALVLADLVRSRMPRLAMIGGGLVVVGAFGLATVSVQSLTATQIATMDDREALLPMLDALFRDPELGWYFIAMVLGAVGAVLLAIAMYRSRVVPRAAAVITGLGIAAVMLTAPGPLRSFVAGSAVIATIGLGWVVVACRSRRTAQD